MKSVILMAFCAVMVVSAPLNVELSVKECAGYPVEEYPVSAVVPLPKGEYNDISRFRVVDVAGSTVPAQFKILNRRWLGDQSIANLQIFFQPTVAAYTGSGSGVSKYYLKDDGTGNTATTQLVVEDGQSAITVITGPLKFIVKKSGFNIIDRMWLDSNNDGVYASSEEVVVSSTDGGGEFKGRLVNDIQFDADRNDVSVVVEESGPMVSVIKAEAFTKYSSPSAHTHGWAVRIYAYANKSFVKVDYQLQNSAKDKKISYPMYFNAMNLNFRLNLASSPTVKIGLGDGTSRSAPLGDGWLLAQKEDSLFTIHSGVDTGSVVSYSGGRSDGYMHIDDGAKGITVVTRNFWRMYPNGISIDGINNLKVGLWPEWSSQINGAKRGPTFNVSALYWLADMQHTFKEVLLHFSATSLSDASLRALARRFDYHPIVTVPVSWISYCKNSLDLEGIIPYTARAVSSDVRTPVELGPTKLGWNQFNLTGRRTGAASAGGAPHGLGQFFVTENPSDWYSAEWAAIGELNVRPQSMAGYKHDRDWPFLHLGVNYCSGILEPECYAGHINWRAQDCGGDVLDSALIEGTESSTVRNIGFTESLPNTHGWLYHIEDAYWITGNPWLRDWYEFMKELRKVFISNGKMPGGISDRANGHFIAQAIAAYRVTGDTTLPLMIASCIKNDFLNKFRRQFGDHNGMCCGSVGEQAFEVGFLVRQVINIMSELRETHPDTWSMLFQLTSGWMDWNYNYANFASTWAPSVAISYYAGTAIVDPQAWYYWNTGRSKYKAHIMQYITTGIGGGTKDLVGFGASSYKWMGEYEGRWLHYMKSNVKVDTTPPEPISNLKLHRSGNRCSLTWTAPIDARRYHVVWSRLPIAGEATENVKFWNWWAANSIGPSFGATLGATETLTFTVPDTGYPLVFAAVFSFDSANNMSRISNLGKSDSTPPTPPSSLAALSSEDAQSVMLSWNASIDEESGISHYMVYRDDTLIGETENGLFVDCVVTEESSYRYSVAAVNNSLTTGAFSAVSAIVPRDLVAPSVVRVTAVSDSFLVTVVFDEPLNKVYAENRDNYALNGATNVLEATLLEDKKTLVLRADTLIPETAYQLSLSGIRDISKSGNQITSTIVSFVYRIPFKFTKPVFKDGSVTPYEWATAKVGERIYIDDVFEIMGIPNRYEGLPMLKFRNDKDVTKTADTLVVFSTNKEVKVYVARDDRIIANYGAARIPSFFTKFNYSNSGDDIFVGMPGRDVLGSGTDCFSVYEQTFPAGTVAIGGNNGYTTMYSNYFVMIEPTDSSLISSVAIKGQSAVDIDDVVNVFPNPFNPAVRIVFSGRQIDYLQTQVMIYDVSGTVVERLSPSSIHKSYLEYYWHAANRSSGIYFLNVNNYGKKLIKKLILLK